MGTYKLSTSAEEDLRRIWEYGLRKFGEAQADKYFYAFFECFERIAESPTLYPSVEEIHPGYRKCICGIDTIYFRVDGDVVEVMSILGRQDHDDWL